MMQLASRTGKAFLARYTRLTLPGLIVCLLGLTTVVAQEKQSVQIKTFDQKLQVMRNVEVSLNGKEYVSVGNKGTVIVELGGDELPVKTVTIRDEKLEAASWNFSKGTIEIIIRPKSYTIVHFVARYPNGAPVPQTSITFNGAKTITVNTNQKGEFDLPLSLTEKITRSDQFHSPNLLVVNLHFSEKENVLILDHPKPASTPPQKGVSLEDELSDFDLSKLDSIKSLTVFYAVFKNISIKDLSKDKQARIDEKFNELVENMEDSLARSHSGFIGSISDSSFVTEDLKSLVNYATLESDALHSNRQDFEDKIKVISDKLEKGITNLSEGERRSLLADLDLLTQLLIDNESKFYKNQNDYRSIINALKEKYFDIQNLETKLSEAEAESRAERQRTLIIGAILAVFTVLIILLISFSSRLRRQARELKAVNDEIKTINENLEDMVVKRTKLLEESNKELDTFLYRSSHDLRAPISSILGLCNITNHISPAELVDRMKGTTLGMDRMLKRLITISEINQELSNRTTISVAKVINEVKSLHEDAIRASGVQFHVDCPADLKLHVSKEVFKSILTNLIENAIFFSTLKGREHSRVEITAKRKGTSLELSVYDNGVGIEESIRPKLFQMFFKGHDMSNGNGLGLYTVHKCVQALRGKIGVETEAGRFTKFNITLPENHGRIPLPAPSSKEPIASTLLASLNLHPQKEDK